MTKLAIIVREGAYDRILTPLAFAYLSAAAGAHVDMLFVNWAVQAVMREESSRLPMSAEHADQLDYVRAQVAGAGLPPDVPDIIRALKATGMVNLYVCSLAAKIFGATPENLMPEVDDIVGATWFLTDKAQGADLMQSF
ncbi:MAG: DsrE family protein [Acidimicrobiales bacterium]